MDANRKTVAFIGASTGVGLSALKHTLAAGHQCIALCRTPSKLTAIFPSVKTPNLQIVQGNAHDISTVSDCLLAAEGKLVDKIISTIGAKPSIGIHGLVMDDPEVCGKGMSTILKALTKLRSNGATGNPHIVVCSTAGMSNFGRDFPSSMSLVYNILLKGPKKDKKVMEDLLEESGASYTIIRPSHLSNGETTKKIRIGIEDPKTGRREPEAIGYAISREDCGRWVAQNLAIELDSKYINKNVMITN